jgi:hypothetical protein
MAGHVEAPHQRLEIDAKLGWQIAAARRHRQIGSVRMRRSGCTMLSRIWNVQDGTYGQS